MLAFNNQDTKLIHKSRNFLKINWSVSHYSILPICRYYLRRTSFSIFRSFFILYCNNNNVIKNVSRMYPAFASFAISSRLIYRLVTKKRIWYSKRSRRTRWRPFVAFRSSLLATDPVFPRPSYGSRMLKES